MLSELYKILTIYLTIILKLSNNCDSLAKRLDSNFLKHLFLLLNKFYRFIITSFLLSMSLFSLWVFAFSRPRILCIDSKFILRVFSICDISITGFFWQLLQKIFWKPFSCFSEVEFQGKLGDTTKVYLKFHIRINISFQKR